MPAFAANRRKLSRMSWDSVTSLVLQYAAGVSSLAFHGLKTASRERPARSNIEPADCLT